MPISMREHRLSDVVINIKKTSDSNGTHKSEQEMRDQKLCATPMPMASTPEFDISPGA
jgi:hypothetical protein